MFEWADIKESIRSGELHISTGILEALSTLSKQRHRVAAIAPEEKDGVPMLQRGVTLAFLRRIVSELAALGRADIDAGQFCNGVHTTSGEADYREFDRSRDKYSGKACALHTDTSFVETCMKVGLTHDPKKGEPYFGTMNTFIW